MLIICLSVAIIMFRCSMCSFGTPNYNIFVSHVVRLHQHDPNFVVHCAVDNCCYSAKKWGAFKTHVWRKHKEIANVEVELEDMEVDGFDEVGLLNTISNDTLTTEQKVRLCSGKYAMSLEADHNLSQRAVDVVFATTSDLIDTHVNHFKEKVHKYLSEQNQPTEFLDSINTESCFDELSSSRKRDSFYTSEFSLLEPTEVKLGSKFVTVEGKLVKKDKVGYIVPFKENLQRLLSMPEVWRFIETPHVSHSGLRDVCDGQYVQNHPLFQTNRKALQIFLHTDDVEIVNPIGSHVKKYKLAIFYFTLGNIPPEFRSRLTAIQLVAIAKSSDLKQGKLAYLLHDFVTTVNALSSDGIFLEISGSNHNIKGALVMVPCDTIASHWLGGFKEGVGFAYKSCRNCMASTKESKEKFLESDFLLRNDGQHKERCAVLQSVSQRARTFWSKMWGINSGSCLLELSDFDVCTCLVQDPMYLLLEGVARYELSLVLKHLIYDLHTFTLDWLNACMKAFPYTYLDKRDLPERIEQKHIMEGNMKQTAASMLVLCCILSYIIGQKVGVDNPKWENFLRLIQITFLSTSPSCDQTTAGLLKLLIYNHHQSFRNLYPTCSVIPKMHYLVHLPRQMVMFGPLRHQWCMRYEGKHGFFKTKKYHNFKNLPKTLTFKHQKYMCHMQMDATGKPTENFLYRGDLVSEGKEIVLQDEFPELVDSFLLFGCMATADMILRLYKADSVEILGHVYNIGCCLCLENEEPDLPVFGQLEAVLVYQNVKYFVLQKLNIDQFEVAMVAYEVHGTEHLVVLPHRRLASKWPLSSYVVGGKRYVRDQYSNKCECF